MSSLRAAAGIRPEQTRIVARGAARLMRRLGYGVVFEMTFASGRRADLVALSPGGEIVVIEVKSGIEDFRADLKWGGYRDYCDRLFFAVAPDFPRTRLPPDVGLIVADGFDGEVLVEPAAHPLVGARRKAVTLAFARLAAQRLTQILDPLTGEL